MNECGILVVEDLRLTALISSKISCPIYGVVDGGKWFWEAFFFAAEKKERKSSSVGRWAKELVRTKYIVLSRSQKYVVEIWGQDDRMPMYSTPARGGTTLLLSTRLHLAPVLHCRDYTLRSMVRMQRIMGSGRGLRSHLEVSVWRVWLVSAAW